MNWTEKHLRGLLFQKKIRSYQAPEKKSGGTPALPQPKSKAITWLDWNLQYWCNEKALTLEKEFKFCDRGWRFDYCIPALKIAIEFEGGIFQQYNDQKSGHGTAKHFTKDTDKYNRAAVLGWKVLRVTALNYTTILKTLSEII